MNILNIFRDIKYNISLSFKTDFLKSKLNQLLDFCSKKIQNIYFFYKNKIMDPSNFKKILKNIDLLYQYKQVTPWPSSLCNAKLVVNNAWRFSDIYSMLNEIIFSNELCLHKVIHPDIEDYIGFSDWNLSQFPFYYSKKTKIQYFQSLSISNFTYPEFVISALVKLIENTFIEKKINFETTIFSITNSISPLLLADRDVSQSIVSILNKLKIVSYFPHPSIAGFLRYLTFTKTCNIINVNKRRPSWTAYLQLFPYFPKSFIDTCVFDCKHENSLLPLYLSLYQYQLSMLSRKEKKDHEKYMNFIKKTIVGEKLLSAHFLDKCELISFYPCLKKKTTSFLVQQAGLIPVAIIMGFGTVGALTNKLESPAAISFRSKIAIDRSQPVTGQVLTAQRRFDPLNPNFSNRHDRSLTRARSSGNRHPEVLKNFLPAVFSPLHDIKAIDFDAEPVAIAIKRLNKSFLIDFFEINGKSYYSYFGISEKYQDLDKLSQELDFEIQKLYPKSKNIIFLIKATDTSESDHYLTTDLRSAFRLKRNQANAVIVPGIFNAMRTNNSFAVEPYTCYDFRIDPTSKKTYTLRLLFQERNTQSFLNWTETLGYKYPLDFQIIDLIAPRMEIGFTVALNNDLKLINDFLRIFNITVDQPQSLIVFQNQLLQVAEQEILSDFYAQTNKYTIGKTRTITMNYALKKLINKEIEMEQISLQLKNLISNPKYFWYVERQRALHHENLTQTFESVIKEFANTPNFDAVLAKKEVAKFFQKLPFLTQSNVLLNESNLGNFDQTGDNNGTRIDYTVLSAQQEAQDEGKEKNAYIRQAQEVADWRKNFETPLKGVYAAKTFIERLIASEGFDDSSSASFLRQVKPDRNDPEVEAWMQKNAKVRNIILSPVETAEQSAPDPFKANERKSQADLNKTNHKYY